MNIEGFPEIAARYHLRDTLPRRYIYSLLAKGIVHFPSLLHNCTPVGIDASTVYRTVDLFRKIGLVTESGIGKHRFVQLITDPSNHFHYLRCEKCGSTVSFDDNILEGLLRTIAKKNNFYQVSSHTIEMTGLCNKCWKANALAE